MSNALATAAPLTGPAAAVDPQVAAILAEPLTAYAKVAAAVEAGYYTTSAILSLAQWLESVDDVVGAEMLREFAARFAAHECEMI